LRIYCTALHRHPTRFKGSTSEGREETEGKRDGRREKKEGWREGREVHLPRSKFLDPSL